jgi:hypothetical protein
MVVGIMLRRFFDGCHNTLHECDMSAAEKCESQSVQPCQDHANSPFDVAGCTNCDMVGDASAVSATSAGLRPAQLKRKRKAFLVPLPATVTKSLPAAVKDVKVILLMWVLLFGRNAMALACLFACPPLEVASA